MIVSENFSALKSIKSEANEENYYNFGVENGIAVFNLIAVWTLNYSKSSRVKFNEDFECLL